MWVDGDHGEQLGRLHCMLSYSKRSAHEVPENFGFWPIWCRKRFGKLPFECMATIYPKFKNMKLSFFVAHAGCLPERVTTRLTDLRILTVRFTEKSPVRLADYGWFVFWSRIPPCANTFSVTNEHEWTAFVLLCLDLAMYITNLTFLTLHQTICSLEWLSEHQKFETAIPKKSAQFCSYKRAGKWSACKATTILLGQFHGQFRCCLCLGSRELAVFTYIMVHHLFLFHPIYALNGPPLGHARRIY